MNKQTNVCPSAWLCKWWFQLTANFLIVYYLFYLSMLKAVCALIFFLTAFHFETIEFSIWKREAKMEFMAKIKWYNLFYYFFLFVG